MAEFQRGCGAVDSPYNNTVYKKTRVVRILPVVRYVLYAKIRILLGKNLLRNRTLMSIFL